MPTPSPILNRTERLKKILGSFAAKVLHHLSSYGWGEQIATFLYRCRKMFILSFISKTPDFMIEQGDVYWADYGYNVGGEINKERPVVVVSVPAVNQGDTFIGIAIQSIKPTTKLWPRKIKLTSPIGNKASYANITKINELSKRRLGKKICKLCDEDMATIKESIKKIFQIQ